jgi:hypothetical protein
MAKSNWQPPSEWSEWSEWLAAGLHARNRWRLPVLLTGILFAHGRRTVTSWLRAAGVADGYSEYYYFLGCVGRKANLVATQLLLLLLRVLPLPNRLLAVIDDSPTKRYGPQVEGAAIHRNPTPGPADQKYLYGHIWVTLSLALRHPSWGALGLPLRAMLYVRRKTLPLIPKKRGWRFRTKLTLAARMVLWMAKILRAAGKTLWVVVDGGYAKRPFLKPVLAAGCVVVGRLRRDAKLRGLPPPVRRGKRRGRGRPPKYGKTKLSLAKRAGQQKGWQQVECTLYNKHVIKTYKTFLATWTPAGGLIRVVLTKEDDGSWLPIFCTQPEASVVEILEAFADRATIEQDFHDVKEVWGAGQQQVRHIWRNVGVYHLNLWMHTLVELWAWNLSHKTLSDRKDSPWDDAERRPSHADRRKALRRHILRTELLTITAVWVLPRKMLRFARQLMALAA